MAKICEVIRSFSTSKKVMLLALIILLVAVITLAIVLPLTLNKGSNNRKDTSYDLVKKTKMDNFTYLNSLIEKNQNVLIGDSITEIYNVGDLFAEYTKKTGIQVFNRGISGDTSDRLLERIYDNAINITPRNMAILVGTNDMGRGLSNESIADNISAMIELTTEKSPNTHIIVEAIYPVYNQMNSASRSMVGGRKNSDIKKANEIIAKAVASQKAKGANVEFVDFTENLMKDGNLNAEYCYDGLHLNAHGFKVVTDLLLQHFV